MEINEIWWWILGGGAAFMVVTSVILSILCTFVPVAGVVYYLYHQKRKADAVRQASQTWRMTYGKVIKSRVEVSGGEVTSVHPKVVYEYEVHGRLYQNDQIRAGDRYWSAGASQEAYQTIDRYPVGRDVTVYYNPDNPAEATLER